MLEGDYAKLRGREGLEGAVERPDWRSGCGNDDNVVGIERSRLRDCQMRSVFVVNYTLTIFLRWFAKRRVRVVAVEEEEVGRSRCARASIYDDRLMARFFKID